MYEEFVTKLLHVCILGVDSISDVVVVIRNYNQLQLITIFEVIFIVIVIGQLEYNVVGNRN